MYFFTENILENYLKNKKFLGSGLEGVCYKIPENRVLKLYNVKLENECTDTFNSCYFLRYKDLNINNFYFIKDVLRIFCYLRGTICDYAPGVSLEEHKLINEPIFEVVNAIREFAVSIQKLSSEGICAFDIFEGNLLYDKGHFSAIDTAHFCFEFDKSVDVYKNNMIGLMKIITESLFDKELFKKNLILDFLYHNNFSLDDEFYLYPADKILIIKSLLEDVCEKELITFSDAIAILERKLR